MSENKNILVVVAHPDDEILGLGGSLLKHAREGFNVYILCLTNGESSRKGSDLSIVKLRQKAFESSCQFIEACGSKILDFPDQGLDTVPLVSIVKAIENYSQNIDPAIVYIHHIGDLNKDHQIAHEAALTAFRPVGSNYPKEILAFETFSSTEWGKAHLPFVPNYFVDISSYVDEKMQCLSYYEGEMRPYPHPRSYKSINIAAQRWGTVVGVTYAEAFVFIRGVK